MNRQSQLLSALSYFNASDGAPWSREKRQMGIGSNAIFDLNYARFLEVIGGKPVLLSKRFRTTDTGRAVLAMDDASDALPDFIRFLPPEREETKQSIEEEQLRASADEEAFIPRHFPRFMTDKICETTLA